MRTTRLGNQFWTPRLNDQQVDIFSLEGDLEGTIKLIDYFNESHLTSRKFLEYSLVASDGSEVFAFLKSCVEISSTLGFGEHVGILRKRPVGLGFNHQTLDLYDHDLNLIRANLPGNDTIILGSQSDFCILLQKLESPGTAPSLLRNLEMETSKPGYYLIRAGTLSGRISRGA